MQRPDILFRLLIGIVAVFTVASAATAQDYPTRAIRIISPVPAGGLSDVALRPMALELQRRLGQPVLVENRAGANTMLAGRACAQAAPDGYTICNLFNDTILNAPFLFKTVGYDPRKDFTPITNGYFITGGFLATPSVNANTLPELIALSKSMPGGLNLGVPGDHHRNFYSQLQYGDRLQLPRNPLQIRKRGRECPAHQFGAGREPRFRQSRTTHPGWQVQGDRGGFATAPVAAAEYSNPEGVQARTHSHQTVVRFFAPAGTPPAIIKRLHDEIVSIYSEPKMRQNALINAGLEPILNTPEEYANFLKVEWDRTARQMQLIGATPQ